jgi:hypothetical protein
MVYVDHSSNSADEFDLRPTDAGANVILLEPFEPHLDALVVVGAQAVDLHTSRE